MLKNSYRNIEHLRLTDEKIDTNIIRKNNIGAFENGDYIHISEKIDGSCASFQYLGNGNFISCSRRKILDKNNTLNGFYDYCSELAKNINLSNLEQLKNKQQLPEEILIMLDKMEDKINDYIFFGEWLGRDNIVKYDNWVKNKWFIFDIYNLKTNSYLYQEEVDIICKELGLLKTHTIAIIPHFNSWDNIKQYANIKNSVYGDNQEGIVIRNESKLNNTNNKSPIILKIVNEKFHEIKHQGKLSPEQFQKKNNNYLVLKELVTPIRIHKIIRKLQEDKKLPEKIKKEHLTLLTSKLPGLVTADIKKEEPEIYKAHQEYSGKIISGLVISYIRNNYLT